MATTTDSAAKPTKPSLDLAPAIAEELKLAPAGVRAVIGLLEGGATVPFIARYRKEQTGGLDEVAIRAIEDKREQLTTLEERRRAVLVSIEEQGKLTPELRAAITKCKTRAELEDLYLPYRPKRKTRASVARERGLLPLAEKILEQPASGSPKADAARFVDPKRDVPDADAALAGARDIVAEIIAERPDVRARVRTRFDREGLAESSAIKSKIKGPTKFESYYEYSERSKTIPSHRWLAMLRGEAEGVLRVKIRVDDEALERELISFGVRRGSPFASELEEAIKDSIKRLLLPSIENDVREELKTKSDLAAVGVFADNLGKLLLAAPLGQRVVLGIDPGQRTGCKCVVVDDTGKLRTHTLFNLVMGAAAEAQAKKTILDLVRAHAPYAIAVGNGTHGRETADFCRAVLRDAPEAAKDIAVVLVSESGASVYSASDVAREEMPDLDLTVRGAVSIARRLQDPLAELVKIDPKAIGVGQYQHDVDQALLAKKLDEVVESCVNAVGVELNTASAPLLAHVAGIGPALAKKIVLHRSKNGAFDARKRLLDVAGLGPKAFEQAAGFVRVRGAKNPLDASAVHPERYGLVERIAKDAGVSPASLIGNDTLIATIPWSKYVDEKAGVGMPTLEDIKRELSKPGRDPRDAFEAPKFRDDVRTIEDVKAGMVLDGVVTNVTAFGAFVDLGVHQDGLVHVSEIADRFVKDPSVVFHVGDLVKVRVLAVDLARKRISLSRRGLASD